MFFKETSAGSIDLNGSLLPTCRITFSSNFQPSRRHPMLRVGMFHRHFLTLLSLNFHVMERCD